MNDIGSMLKTVERQGRRLTELVGDLLLLVSLERHLTPPNPEPCCLNDLIDDLVEEFLASAIAAKVALTSQLPDTAITIVGDTNQLYRLVSNLIANAIQHTPRDGQVKIILAQHDRVALIQVQDTGVGIAPDEQARIFERFYPCRSRSRSHNGWYRIGISDRPGNCSVTSRRDSSAKCMW